VSANQPRVARVPRQQRHVAPPPQIVAFLVSALMS